MKLKRDSVEGVVELYKTTPEFTRKIQSHKTRAQYRYQLDKLCALEGVGTFPLKKLNVAKCQQIYWQILDSVEGEGTRFANYTLQIVTRAWNVLMRYDILEKNPWRFVERAKIAPRNTVWEPEDFRMFLTTAFMVPKWRNIGLLVRINVELGQRIEDIRLSKWENYNLKKQLYIREVIEKTKERIPGIPLSDGLTKMLQEQKETYDFQEWVVPHPFTLRPYSENNIARSFRTIMREAGLASRLQLRDIRRTVLTDLANCGATDTEIMSYSGHKNRESLGPYVRISTEQARNAAAKRNFNPDTFFKEGE
tara:strand:- start:644 stop:1567 length:924 start_codon:yes stop_codon:yes gene_type:complete